MKILVDADACPVKEIIERVGKENNIPVIMIIDTSHILKSDYCEILTVSKAPDAVDLALINKTETYDIVVTGDYGVAALALGKGAYVIHHRGKIYTNENIELMLFERHISKTQRRKGRHKSIGHQKKRTKQDDEHFEISFKSLCKRALHTQHDAKINP